MTDAGQTDTPNGSIIGHQHGISIGNGFVRTINNDGDIRGISGDGISLSSGRLNQIESNGTIAGGTHGFSLLDSSIGGFTNKGEIAGTAGNGLDVTASETEELDPARWLTRGGLGVTTAYVNGLEVSVRYDVEARKSFTNQTASVKLRLPF